MEAPEPKQSPLWKNRVLYLASGGGIAALIIAWIVSPARSSFWSDTLINGGVAALLLVPLWLIQQSLGRRIAQTESRTESVQRQVEDVQTQLESITADSLSQLVIDRLAAARTPDIELFRNVRDEPTQQTIDGALKRAFDLHLVSARGLRVSLYDTPYHLRFAIPEAIDDAVLTINLETIDGEVLTTFGWEPTDMTAVELGVEIASYLQEHASYPGDLPFQFGRVFHALADAFQMTFENRSGAGGITGSLWPLIEAFPPQWAITDLGVECIDPWQPYQIKASRFGDLDWDPHVTSKGWVDLVSFRMAFETAQEFRKRGLL